MTLDVDHPMLTVGRDGIAAGRVGLPWSVQADLVVAGGPCSDNDLDDRVGFAVAAVLGLIGQPPLRVYARFGRHWHDDTDDSAVLMIDHDHDLTSTVAVALTARLAAIQPGQPAVHRYRVSGSHGVLELDLLRPGLSVRNATTVRHRLSGADSSAETEDRPSTNSGPFDGDAAAVLEAARRSAVDNKRVEVIG